MKHARTPTRLRCDKASTFREGTTSTTYEVETTRSLSTRTEDEQACELQPKPIKIPSTNPLTPLRPNISPPSLLEG